MSLSDAARTVAADAVAGVAAKMRLHTGDPGAGFANEVGGGGYGPQDVTWDPAVAGLADMAAEVVFPCPPVDVFWVTISTADLTTQLGKALLDPEASFPVLGFLHIEAADLDFTA